MSKVLHIKEWHKDTNIIDNDIEILEIDELKYPLSNLPISLNEINVKISYDVYKRENKIPYGCKLNIEHIKIYDLNVLNRINKEDYLDITSIHLQNKKLKEIPDIIFNLVNVKALFLSANQITTIPESIDKLVNLEYLYLWENKITFISENIGNLVNLKIFDITNTPINIVKHLPKHIRLKFHI